MTTSEILMICLTAVIATVGVIGAVIFNNQLAAMHGQLDEMKAASKIAEDTLVAAQRPWISIDSAKTRIGPRGLFYDKNGANLHMIFVLKNTGHTPAVNLQIIGGPRIDVSVNDRMIELKKVCDDAKKGEYLGLAWMARGGYPGSDRPEFYCFCAWGSMRRSKLAP